MPGHFICLKHRAIERIKLFRVELRAFNASPKDGFCLSCLAITS